MDNEPAAERVSFMDRMLDWVHDVIPPTLGAAAIALLGAGALWALFHQNQTPTRPLYALQQEQLLQTAIQTQLLREQTKLLETLVRQQQR